MNVNLDSAGFTKATVGFRQAVKRFLLRGSLAIFLRFSGFFLLGLIAYLHFIFRSATHEARTIEAWMAGYLGYLLIVEFVRYRKTPIYDSTHFIVIRIFLNLILLSWLLYAAPVMRGLLVFTYLIPIIATIVYFPQNRGLLVSVFASSLVGISLAAVAFDSREPLTLGQFGAMATVLWMVLIALSQVYNKLAGMPKSISEILTRLQGPINFADTLDLISEGISMITGADKLFILVVDPDDRSYVTHKMVGLNLSPWFSMEELIRQCDAIQRGRSYVTDDLEVSGDKQYFQQFFEPPPRAIFIEPIVGSSQDVLGLVMMGGANPGQFDEWKKALFLNFVQSVSAAVETSLLYERARLSFLSRKSIAEQLLEAEKEAEIVGILVEQASRLIGNAAGVVLHRYESDLACLVAEGGVKQSDTGKRTLWQASHPVMRKLEPSDVHLGIAGKALHNNMIVVVDDVRKHAAFVGNAERAEFISLMSAPMYVPGSKVPLGTLSVQSAKRAAFSPEDQLTLLYLAKQGAISMARVQDSAEWRIKGGILKEIFESTLEVNYESDEQILTQQLAEIARTILPFRMVRIRLFDPVTRELIGAAAAGYPLEDQHALLGSRLPLEELEKFLSPDYQMERSFLIPWDAPDWKEFADRYLYVPQVSDLEDSAWDKYDALFTPLRSENGELIGFISWDQPGDSLHPTKRIIEAMGAFASMASWSIDLVRAYRRIAEQRGLIGSLISATTERLATTRDSNVINEVAVKMGSERLGTEACSLYLAIENQLELASSTYLKNTSYIKRRKQIRAEPGSGLTSWVAATLKPIYFNSEAEYQNHLGWAGETEQLQYLPSGTCKNLLFAPIIGRSGSCVGVLSFENKLENGRIADFSYADVSRALFLAEELGLSLGLAEQFKNVKTLEQQMLEDDLHELKNHYYSGVQVLADTSIYWLRQREYARVQNALERLLKNSRTILNELYSLHNTVQTKYYEIENFREALNFMADSILRVLAGHERKFKEERARIRVFCPNDIQLTPLMRYAFLRICSGALMNAIQHSGFINEPAITIKIHIQQVEDDKIRLLLRDNGHGQKRIRPGYGIGRMRYLVGYMTKQGFDIRLHFSSSEAGGTEVVLTAGLIPKEF